MKHRMIGWAVVVAAGLWAGLAPAATNPPGGASNLQQYDTRYYVIYTDLKGDDVKEAALRMTKMAEEYHARTRGFAGIINQRLPFYLFSKGEDYAANGGLPGSAGLFVGTKLMAIAGTKTGGGTWHVVQHEGFHQFAHFVIRGGLPAWLNEGLAEYFGEGVFTGDGFVTGVLPPWRLARVKKGIETEAFKPMREIMTLTQQAWNSGLSINNYDQAWSMVHFLAHGDGGKYQEAFAGFVNALGRGMPYERAWLDNLGPADRFEARWKEYYQGLDEDPTAAQYTRAKVEILTSFLARAVSQKQTFEKFDDFVAAGKTGALKVHAQDWLPPGLLADAIEALGKDEKWSLEAGGKQPQIVCERDGGTRVVGSFTLKGDRVVKVSVEIDDLPQTLAKAKELSDAGKKDKARDLLRDALKDHPRSPHAEAAKKMMAEQRK